MRSQNLWQPPPNVPSMWERFSRGDTSRLKNKKLQLVKLRWPTLGEGHELGVWGTYNYIYRITYVIYITGRLYQSICSGRVIDLFVQVPLRNPNKASWVGVVATETNVFIKWSIYTLILDLESILHSHSYDYQRTLEQKYITVDWYCIFCRIIKICLCNTL